MLDGSKAMALGDSLLLSGIGMFIVFMELALLAVLILVISKAIRALTGGKAAAMAGAVTPAPVAVAPIAASVAAAPVAAGGLTLTDVDAPTAATAMAVVSHQTGIPLNHLDFHSVKGVVELGGVEEREAAIIMALTAHKLDKPLDHLIFKSIKKV